MNIGKNKRTKISTIIAIGAYLNMLLATFDPSVIADNRTAMLIYQILSAVLALCAWVNSHYYNQDFTEAACEGTGHTRQIKAEMTPGYVGERFFTNEDGTPLEREEIFEEAQDEQ